MSNTFVLSSSFFLTDVFFTFCVVLVIEVSVVAPHPVSKVSTIIPTNANAVHFFKSNASNLFVTLLLPFHLAYYLELTVIIKSIMCFREVSLSYPVLTQRL